MNPFPHSTVMYNKKVAIKIGGYNEKCEKSIDYNLYLEFIRNGYKFCGINKRLVDFRFHLNSWGRCDDDGLQFQYGLIGLLNFFQENNKQIGILSKKNKNWEKSKNLFKHWFFEQNFIKQIRAKRFLNEARSSFNQKNFNAFFSNLVNAYREDKLFFLYRGIRFKYPEDIIKLNKYFKKNN